MNSGLSKADLQIILDVFKKYPEVETAILYGSRAMGNFKNGSDIDIALKGTNLKQETCSNIHFELEEETLLPYFFDITNYNLIENIKLREHIDRVGKVLYSKTDMEEI